ncbi:MAG: para-nitrobenzyl esterase [Actinomycetota bacterium]|nr:para-nitrobenzyl esterase [Actinomycetota bacterium]
MSTDRGAVHLTARACATHRPGWVRGDDYLTVSVWAPPSARERPVLVFVHGGGFVTGSTRSPLYDGTAFARDGVVLVTVDYRLGVPGYLDLPGAPGNRGLLDVVAALRWVRENIAAFGGDPGNVTLAGRSAGATIAAGVLATPEANGLFRRAIVQSGNGLGAFTPEQAARVTHAAASVLGVEPTVTAFGEVPDERFVATQPGGLDPRTATDFDPLLGLSAFSLVLDRQPAEALATSAELLIGTNADEGALYLAPRGNLVTSTERDPLETAGRVAANPTSLVSAHRTRRPQATPGELRSAIMGDALFGTGRRRLAEGPRRRVHLRVRVAIVRGGRSARRGPHDGTAVRLRQPATPGLARPTRSAGHRGATRRAGDADASGVGRLRADRRPGLGAVGDRPLHRAGQLQRIPRIPGATPVLNTCAGTTGDTTTSAGSRSGPSGDSNR